MGIKNLNKFIREKCPHVTNKIHLSLFAYRKVAIDVSLYMHKYNAIFGDQWISAFISLVACLRANEIHCVFIFDGQAPVDKKVEQDRRKEEKEKLFRQAFILQEALDDYHQTGNISQALVELYQKSRKNNHRLLGSTKEDSIDMKLVEERVKQKCQQAVDITSEDFASVKELFSILKIPWYIAATEAEKTCSQLCISGLVDAVLSEDSDILAYGAPIFLNKIDTGNQTCDIIEHQDLLNQLELGQEQFLELCIMCGTDYNKNIPKVGPCTAYKYIMEHKSIDNISRNTSIDVSILNHTRGKELFMEFEDHGIDHIPYCAEPNWSELETFLQLKKVSCNIEKIKKSFIREIVILEE